MRTAVFTMKPVYYDCGVCDHFHPWDWNGDCRDDANRLTYDDLDNRHGENGYELRSMEERLSLDLSSGSFEKEAGPSMFDFWNGGYAHSSLFWGE